MIKNNKQLITDWNSLYMMFNDDVEVDIFEEDCADEFPLMNLLNNTKDDPIAFEHIVGFFYSHYACLWHNNATGESDEVEAESPEWYEGEEAYRQKILSIATYFKMQNIEEQLTNDDNNIEPWIKELANSLRKTKRLNNKKYN